MPANIVRAHIDGSRAQPFQRFIQSCDFLNGFVRLVRHAWKENGDVWTTEEENRIALYFKNIYFKHASGLSVILFLTEGKNIEQEEKKIIENQHEFNNDNLEVSKESVCIYFNIDEDEWLENIKAALSIHFSEVVFSRLKDNSLMILREMIGVYESPGQIDIILRRENIPGIEPSMEMKEMQPHPKPGTKPGTFVPRGLHQYLDNDYGMFDPKEDQLVALEIDDPALDVDDTLEESVGEENNDNIELSTTYIYVRILEKIKPESEIKLLQEYKIDDGSENPCTVKAFQLFKITAKTENISKEQRMEISEESSLGDNIGISVSMQMAYAEVGKCLAEALKQPEYVRRRIVKRLLFKWDPLKTPDSVSQCTEVYNFIQYCLLCLEKGLNLPEGPDDYRDTEADRSRNWWSSWYGRYMRRHERYNQYNRDECDAVPPGGYSSYRTDRKKEPYHWYSECRRWQKQAVSDLANSKYFIRSTPSETFNWVCYKAHQAAEKSLKAAWYAKDANQIHSVKFSHDIVSIASGLGSDLVPLADALANLVGEHTRMRYPDSLRGQLIPADAYNRQTAETAVHLAKQIIEIVKRYFVR